MNRLRLLVLPPWRRAPGRLFHAASLFWAVAVAALVLGIAGGSRPLFASSAASAALHSDITNGCSYDVGLRVQRQASTQVPAPPVAIGVSLTRPVDVAQGTSILNEAVADLPGLAAPVITLFGGSTEIDAAAGGHRTSQIQLLARTHATEHVQVLHSVSAPGIWLPDSTARAIGVAAGGRVVLVDNLVRSPLTVHAVFRDLTEVKRDRSWCSLEQTIDGFGLYTPAPTALIDPATMLRVLHRSGLPTAGVWWEYAPDPSRWTVAAAKQTMPALSQTLKETNDVASSEGRVLGLGTSAVDRQLTLSHSAQAQRTGSASVGPVALGGAGVALLVLLIGARTWLDRRRKEVTLLAMRGAGAGMLAVKGVLEMAVPMLLGGAIGILAGDLVVRIVGPSAAIESHAIANAVALVAAGLGVSLAAVALAVWLGVRRVGIETTGAVARTRLLLWEPAVLALAAAAFYELSTRGTAATSARPGAQVDSLVLLFPVLLLAGCAGLLARAALGGNALRRSTGRFGTWAWLAARRLSAGRLRAVPVITGAAVAIGIVVFSGTLAASLRATITGKSTLGIGAAQAFTLDHPQPLPARSALAASATEVTRTKENTAGRGDHPLADVLGVDPATFRRGAYWDASFANRSLPALLAKLAAPRSGAVPVIAVGPGLPDRFVLSLDAQHGAASASTAVTVEVAARARAFPGFGFESSQPLVVVDRAVLDRLGVTNSPEVWVNRTDPLVRGQLLAAGMTVTTTARAADLVPADLQPQLWALDYIQVIGLAAGIVTLCGLGLYFSSVSERRRLGTALARQMGLSRRGAVAATASEIAAMLTTGLVLGTGLSLLAVRLVFDHIDSTPQIPPAAIFRLDLGRVGVCAAGTVLATLLVTTIVERRAGRSSLPELLRRAD